VDKSKNKQFLGIFGIGGVGGKGFNGMYGMDSMEKVWIFFECENCECSFEVEVRKSEVNTTKVRCLCGSDQE